MLCTVLEFESTFLASVVQENCVLPTLWAFLFLLGTFLSPPYCPHHRISVTNDDLRDLMARRVDLAHGLDHGVHLRRTILRGVTCGRRQLVGHIGALGVGARLAADFGQRTADLLERCRLFGDVLGQAQI